jgi:hypothetical protein
MAHPYKGAVDILKGFSLFSNGSLEYKNGGLHCYCPIPWLKVSCQLENVIHQSVDYFKGYFVGHTWLFSEVVGFFIWLPCSCAEKDPVIAWI